MGVPLPWFTALFFAVCALLSAAGVALLIFAARAVLGMGGPRRALELVAAEVVYALILSLAFSFFALAPVGEVSFTDEQGRTVTVYEYEENPYLPALAVPLAAAIVSALLLIPLAATWFYSSTRRVVLLVER